MKTTTICLAVVSSLAFAARTADAQSATPAPAPKSGIQLEKHLSFMAGYVPGTGAFGGGLVVEPNIEVIDNLHLGLRTGILISGGGSLGGNGEDVSVGVGVNVSALGNVTYALPTGSVKPTFGLGAGLYYLISQDVSAGNNTSVTQQAGEFFGVSPQIGIQLGSVRLAAAYNAILGANIEVVQQVGAEAETKRQDYLSVEFGFGF